MALRTGSLPKAARKSNSSDRLKKVQLSFYAEQQDYARLKALSARTGVPQQVYLRRALAQLLQINEAAYVQNSTERARAQLQQAKDSSASAVADFKALQEETLRVLSASKGRHAAKSK